MAVAHCTQNCIIHGEGLLNSNSKKKTVNEKWTTYKPNPVHLSISETPNLLGLSHTASSRVYADWCKTHVHKNWRRKV